MRNELTMIKKFAAYHYGILRKQGFKTVELEELEGEFGVVYATAIKCFDSNKEAGLETYMARCFANRVNGIRRQITEETTCSREYFLNYYTTTYAASLGAVDARQNTMNVKMIAFEFLDKLGQTEKAYLAEALNLSKDNTPRRTKAIIRKNIRIKLENFLEKA